MIIHNRYMEFHELCQRVLFPHTQGKFPFPFALSLSKHEKLSEILNG